MGGFKVSGIWQVAHMANSGTGFGNTGKIAIIWQNRVQFSGKMYADVINPRLPVKIMVFFLI
jgi:hypothetical protein